MNKKIENTDDGGFVEWDSLVVRNLSKEQIADAKAWAADELATPTDAEYQDSLRFLREKGVKLEKI